MATILGGTGGPGVSSSISGSSAYYSGGGGGNIRGGTGSAGGLGGGGAGSGTGAGQNAFFYGGGGGAAGSGAGTGQPGGNGYQGVVIISYPISASTSVPSLSGSGSYTFNTSTAGQTLTITQNTSGVGTITWTYTTLPSGLTVSYSDSTQIIFAIQQYSVTALQTFTVTATGTYGSGSLSIPYSAGGNAPVVSTASPYTFDTSSGIQTLTLTQTASGTGPISWSYDYLPPGVTVTTPLTNSSIITFSVAQYSACPLETFSLRVSNPYGVLIVPVSMTLIGPLPVLSSASPYVITTGTAGQTVVVTQSASRTGPITWSYDSLPSGLSLSSSDSTQITFSIAQGSSAPQQTFLVEATGAYGGQFIAISYTAVAPPWVSAATQLADPGFGSGKNLGTSVSINSTNTVIVSGAPLYLGNTGGVAAWRYSGGSWGSPTVLPDPGLGLGSRLGHSVSINSDGTVVTSGAQKYNGNTGGVAVWTYSGGSWGTPVTLPDPGLGTNGYLGYSVSINSDGTVVTAGAYSYNSNQGAVVVWRNSGGSWGSPIVLPDPGLGTNTSLGYSVCINSDGTVVTAGAYGYNSSQGTVVVWRYSGGSWGTPVTLPDPGLGTNGYLGYSVSINSDGTVVTSGAFAYNSAQGAVVVWRYSGGSWGSAVTLPDPGLGTNGYLGYENGVSINSDGTVVTAGAPGYNGVTGAVVVWTYSGGSWGSPTVLPDPGLGTYGLLGSVAINAGGTCITSGAYFYPGGAGQGTVVVWNK